jgi:multiple RNA-binding domain-containing protein 1
VFNGLVLTLAKVHVPQSRSSGTGKGFAFLEFESPEHAQNALEVVDGTSFQGRIIHVLHSAPKKEPKLDEVALSKLPYKMQQLVKQKRDAGQKRFNWNALFMNVSLPPNKPWINEE